MLWDCLDLATYLTWLIRLDQKKETSEACVWFVHIKRETFIYYLLLVYIYSYDIN